MFSPAGSPQQAGPALQRTSWAGSQLRVGDAERMAIADQLAKHFVDGRLDDTEFDERLDRAMRATTMADLTGLLSDLSDDEPRMLRDQLERERLQLRHERRRQRQAARRHRAWSLGALVLLVAAAITVVFVVRALTHSIGAWLLLGLIAFVWLRRDGSRYRGS